MQKIFWN